jgi:hypothetical protein
MKEKVNASLANGRISINPDFSLGALLFDL